MIYRIAFNDLVAHLHDLGFVETEGTPDIAIFVRGDELFTIRKPNIDGHLPEALANDALDRAGLDVPSWIVFWCD